LKKVTAPPQIQVALPNLSTDGRACFYGYDVGIDWLIEYGAANWIWTPVEKVFSNDISMASGAMKLLRLYSGIKHLKFKSALKDHTVPSDAVTVPGHRGIGDHQVPLISIFNDRGSSFRNRPSQQQVDRLSEILGKQPRWWVNYENPKTR
jgi:hypothetical protein